MTVKDEFLNKANLVLEKCEDGSEDEEAVVRDCVETLNLLKKSKILFEMAMEDATFSKLRVCLLAEQLIACPDLHPFWKEILQTKLTEYETSSSTDSST